MLFRSVLSAAACTAVAGTASAVPVSFTDFNANNGTFLEGVSSGTTTADGVTLTMSTGSGIFEGTGGGTGIVGPGETRFTNPGFNVSSGESYTLSFDTAGTLIGLTARLFDGTHTITVSAADGDSATFSTALSAQAPDSDVPLGLSFAAGEVLTVDNLSTGTGGNVGYRINAVNIDAIPEPASAALALAGGVLLLKRRRDA
ncbi:hypothetical protein [Phycisphaera mikurensis]|uniref:PEP-CTERM protein-sorting domain-containing protein n=1 Tax=Phycisphaera mikurensis (strain NBRC 102666 / KCTC 22515 / FYK2301M01) TaxID=1142394 RepID=I0IDH2_PHYMF|nr:hypothetical protein [Phycisphaera mikurensis]MBB6441131.1 hypothetical protein [Phycisphaera mikurensis]BAM03310.1 hypothetical protein PSMK_11510 [Phycisphaera mikurensis NBRC 102666]